MVLTTMLQNYNLKNDYSRNTSEYSVNERILMLYKNELVYARNVVMSKNELSKKEKIKKVFIIITVIWISKIAICVAIREYQNSNFLWMYENSKYNSVFDLHIDRQFHFFSLKYGVFGISYHYTIDGRNS